MIKIPVCHINFFTFVKSNDISYILIDPVVNMVVVNAKLETRVSESCYTTSSFEQVSKYVTLTLAKCIELFTHIFCKMTNL